MRAWTSALLIADFFITFTDEVQRIWRRRFTGATLIFTITRYTALFERIVLLISVLLPTIQDQVRAQLPSHTNCLW